MELAVRALDGTTSATVSVPDNIFDSPFREGLVHQAVVAYLANGRSDTVGQKSRGDVRGGGRKPWAQKGTGRARAGTTRGPLWRGGGKTFVANDRHHHQKLNRKMYKAAMRSIFSELTRQERLLVTEEFDVKTPKTKELIARLDAMDLRQTLIVVVEPSVNLTLAVRNLARASLAKAALVDPVSLIGAEKVLITKGALVILEERLR